MQVAVPLFAHFTMLRRRNSVESDLDMDRGVMASAVLRRGNAELAIHMPTLEYQRGHGTLHLPPARTDLDSIPVSS